jgi:hypothetical protein
MSDAHLPPSPRRLLSDAGYRLRVRHHLWTECYVERGAERWEGRGASEDEAVIDVLTKMLPSHLVRMLLQAQGPSPLILGSVAKGNAEPPSDVARAGAPSGVASAGDAVTAPRRADDACATLGAAESGDMGDASATVQVTATTLRGTAIGPSAGSAPQSALPQTTATAELSSLGAERQRTEVPASPNATPPDPTPVDAIEEVAGLVREIDDRMEHLGRMSSDRQRRYLMMWICRARALEEAHRGAHEVVRAVARVARRLTDIAKMFWPGTVRAMQLSAGPSDVRSELHALWARPPATWHEAAGLAERALADHVAESREAGYDEDGWADTAALTAAPPGPDAMLAELDAAHRARDPRGWTRRALADRWSPDARVRRDRQGGGG